MNFEKSISLFRWTPKIQTGERATRRPMAGPEEPALEVPPKEVSPKDIGPRFQAIGFFVLRYGLALVIGWIGFMKFTAYEAMGIQPLVAHSPFMSWMYHLLSVRQLSNCLGVVEVSIAVLIALRVVSSRICAIGSALAVLMLLTTLSFLFSTPGWEPSLGGFPALSALPGQFLLKDIVLLGTAIWSLGEALTARTRLVQTHF